MSVKQPASVKTHMDPNRSYGRVPNDLARGMTFGSHEGPGLPFMTPSQSSFLPLAAMMEDGGRSRKKAPKQPEASSPDVPDKRAGHRDADPVDNSTRSRHRRTSQPAAAQPESAQPVSAHRRSKRHRADTERPTDNEAIHGRGERAHRSAGESLSGTLGNAEVMRVGTLEASTITHPHGDALDVNGVLCLEGDAIVNTLRYGTLDPAPGNVTGPDGGTSAMSVGVFADSKGKALASAAGLTAFDDGDSLSIRKDCRIGGTLTCDGGQTKRVVDAVAASEGGPDAFLSSTDSGSAVVVDLYKGYPFDRLLIELPSDPPSGTWFAFHRLDAEPVPVRVRSKGTATIRGGLVKVAPPHCVPHEIDGSELVLDGRNSRVDLTFVGCCWVVTNGILFGGGHCLE